MSRAMVHIPAPPLTFSVRLCRFNWEAPPRSNLLLPLMLLPALLLLLLL
jgi:hypothetical protein